MPCCENSDETISNLAFSMFEGFSLLDKGLKGLSPTEFAVHDGLNICSEVVPAESLRWLSFIWDMARGKRRWEGELTNRELSRPVLEGDSENFDPGCSSTLLNESGLSCGLVVG